MIKVEPEMNQRCFLFHVFFLLFKTWCLHYPQCSLATKWHHWRQFIRLHAASSGDSRRFILLFHICSGTLLDLSTQFVCEKRAELPFSEWVRGSYSSWRSKQKFFVMYFRYVRDLMWVCPPTLKEKINNKGQKKIWINKMELSMNVMN